MCESTVVDSQGNSRNINPGMILDPFFNNPKNPQGAIEDVSNLVREVPSLYQGTPTQKEKLLNVTKPVEEKVNQPSAQPLSNPQVSEGSGIVTKPNVPHPVLQSTSKKSTQVQDFDTLRNKAYLRFQEENAPFMGQSNKLYT